MNKEMIISVNAYEKRVAILENGVVVEFYVERADESKAVVGNIYKGKVRKVLPGMQSAFVDIGLERDAFLYVGDFFEETEEDLDTTESLPRLPVERSERSERPPEPVRREIDGRRGGRDRRPEVPAGRPAVTGAPEEAAAVALKPEEVTASPRLPEAPGEDGPSAEDAGMSGWIRPCCHPCWNPPGPGLSGSVMTLKRPGRLRKETPPAWSRPKRWRRVKR